MFGEMEDEGEEKTCRQTYLGGREDEMYENENRNMEIFEGTASFVQYGRFNELLYFGVSSERKRG